MVSSTSTKGRNDTSKQTANNKSSSSQRRPPNSACRSHQLMCEPTNQEVPGEGFADDIMKGFASIVPPDADVSAVAEAIVKVVDAPFGKRPFRVHLDPAQDGAEVVNAVSDRVRAELLRRIGLGDLLTPRDVAGQSHSAA